MKITFLELHSDLPGANELKVGYQYSSVSYGHCPRATYSIDTCYLLQAFEPSSSVEACTHQIWRPREDDRSAATPPPGYGGTNGTQQVWTKIL